MRTVDPRNDTTVRFLHVLSVLKLRNGAGKGCKQEMLLGLKKSLFFSIYPKDHKRGSLDNNNTAANKDHRKKLLLCAKPIIPPDQQRLSGKSRLPY